MSQSVLLSIPTPEAMMRLGALVAAHTKPGDLFFLQGPLGAGKTTWVRGFLRGLGFSGIVKSPTYTIVETYALPMAAVCHFDCYRVADARELFAMGLEDYLTTTSIGIFEWPEQIKRHLPQPSLALEWALAFPVTTDDTTQRQVWVRATTARGEAIVGAIVRDGTNT